MIINNLNKLKYNFIKFNSIKYSGNIYNIFALTNSVVDIQLANNYPDSIWLKNFYQYYDMDINVNINQDNIFSFRQNNYIKLNKQFVFPNQFTFIFQFKISKQNKYYQQSLCNFSDIFYIDFNTFNHNHKMICNFIDTKIIYDIQKLKTDEYNILLIRYKNNQFKLTINGQNIIQHLNYEQNNNVYLYIGCKNYTTEFIDNGFYGDIKNIQLYSIYKQNKQLINYY